MKNISAVFSTEVFEDEEHGDWVYRLTGGPNLSASDVPAPRILEQGQAVHLRHPRVLEACGKLTQLLNAAFEAGRLAKLEEIHKALGVK